MPNAERLREFTAEPQRPQRSQRQTQSFLGFALGGSSRHEQNEAAAHIANHAEFFWVKARVATRTFFDVNAAHSNPPNLF